MLNTANRQVCDVDIRDMKTKEPFLFFDTANTTTTSLSGDSVYAMADGARRVAFQNPMEGTLAIEAQVYPFELFALISDGTIDSSAIYAEKKTIKCTTAGEIALTDTPETGTVFVYAEGDFGGTKIVGTFASGKFTATTPGDIVVDSYYEVGYLVTTSSNISKVSLRNDKSPKDCYITANTLQKDEDGTLTPFKLVFYKASVQRNVELAFSSEGDPVTITLTFDLLEDKKGNFVDMIEITA